MQLADGVAVITLNRPEVMNALTPQMRAEICRGAAARRGRGAGARADRGGAGLLLGSGSGRCRGAGRGSISNAMLRDEYEPMLRAIADCPVPMIAAVNGAAAGAGANLALACDVVIAAESASFIQAFTRIGLIPDAGGT